MSNGSQDGIGKVANSDLLTAIARVVTIVAPMVFVPLLAWLFSTVTDTANTVAIQSVKIENIDRRTTGIEQKMRENDADLRIITEERRKDWIDIRERVTRVEVQTTAITTLLQQLIDRIDAKERKRGNP